MRRITTTAALCLAAVVACTGQTAQASNESLVLDSLARQDSINRAQPGYVIDSIFPAEEELRRFNAGSMRPAALSGGASDRETLVRQFARALQQADTATLRTLLLTRAEFGHLVFPESPFAREPFKTKPGLVWMQLVAASERGMTRLLDRVSGPGVQISSLRCDRTPEDQGPNTYWRNCSVLVHRQGTPTHRAQLFGQILVRDGRAKFVAYDGDF
ncbi:MAG: hypothetical protein AB1762_04945 [Gemmatimonadota bacterium]